MPLILAGLQNSLAAMMRGPSFAQNPAQAAAKWAKCYRDYAQGATTLAGDSAPDLSANEATMKGLLTVAFASPVGPPPLAAAGIAQAFTAFWMLPPVVFVGPPISAIVTLAPGGPILQAGLLALWPTLAVSRAPADVAAAQHAALFDAATRTVIVTHVMPPPAPPVIGPIF